MAATLTASGPVPGDGTETITLSGDTASTNRVFQAQEPDGSVGQIKITTDGSGNATISWVPQLPGSTAYSILEASPAVIVGPVTSNSGSE